MRCSKILVPVMVLASCLTALAQGRSYKNLGRTPTPEEIRTTDTSIGPEGKELPQGHGTALEGATIFAAKCAICHSANADMAYGSTDFSRMVSSLAGGKGTLNTAQPLLTVGSFWPFAPTIWDYINRAMPRGAEGSLTANEVYALSAFVLFKNDLIKQDEVMDAKSLPKVQMPNRNGFIPARPNWKKYNDCNPNLLKCIGTLTAQ